MGESDGQVIERLTRENMLARALIGNLEATVEALRAELADTRARVAGMPMPDAMARRDERIAELEGLLEKANDRLYRRGEQTY